MRRFGDLSGALPADLRAFPSSEGRVVDKEKVVQTAEELARLTNRPVRSPEGDRLYGGHVWRISGSRHLASIGIALWLIQLIARWAGPTILRYVAEAPLLRVTDEYKAKYCRAQEKSAFEEIRTALSDLSQRMDQLESSRSNIQDAGVTEAPLGDKQVQSLESEITFSVLDTLQPLLADDVSSVREDVRHVRALADQDSRRLQDLERNLDCWRKELAETRRLAKVSAPPSVIVSEFRVAHCPVVMGAAVNLRDWRTRCGWRFGHSVYEPAESVPRRSEEICTGCFPSEKKKARERENKGGDSEASETDTGDEEHMDEMGSSLSSQLDIGVSPDAPGSLDPGNLGAYSELPAGTPVMQL